ncbi:MAG: ABC transporter ATP-binding protein [Deltaproteobacteria bacterium]|nr:ABC transporter ATP-binding protein [Deltaproteobacteria bacterium]
MTVTPLLEAVELSRAYGACVANERVSLALRAGRIHALVGENGAGKSTLCRMLFGLVRPDAGRILVDGRAVTLRSPRDAMAAGLGMVHQHFMLVDELTVAQNVVLGREPRRGGRMDLARAEAETAELAARFGLAVDPRAPVGGLAVGVQQRVEILKALHGGARVLLLDEPTAVLTAQEVDALLAVLRRLRDEGRAILVVTHKLPEVMAVSDEVTVLRQGRVVGRLDTAATSAVALSELMVGRHVDLSRRPRTTTPAEERLRVEDLVVRGPDGRARVNGVSLSVRAGEVVGIAGVEGNGQAELVEGLCGARSPASGRVVLCGQDVSRASVRRRRDAGLCHVPEDRLAQGLVPAMAVADNAVLGVHHRAPASRGGVLRRAGIAAAAQALVRAYDVRPADPALPVAALSGGNQQKVLVGRELSAGPRVVILAQPTRGVDVGAMERIHAAILAARDAGLAILLVSAELTELLALSDVIHVLYRGRIVHTVDAAAATVESLGPPMLGAGVAA